MKRISLLALLGLFLAVSAESATPTQAPATRGRTQTADSAQTPAPAAAPASQAATQTTSARAARATGARSPAAPAQSQAVSARSATPASVAQPQAVSARAATTQKVVSSNTTINAAASNSGVVDQICRDRWFGCMDSFCMADNENGGRCLCSSRKAELDQILLDIERLDAESFKMATEGVERINYGAQADYIFQQQQAASRGDGGANSAENRRQQLSAQLDFTAWNNAFTAADEVEEIINPLADRSGDALFSYVRNICLAQMSGCEKDLQMLQTMYAANISSDCRAYENELKKRQQSSAQKLAAAERALREAALESFESSNKFDAGQCAYEFRRCMMSTGGCGDDFTKCVGIAASQNVKGKGAAAKTHRIQGATTFIEIAASSYDSLMAKRPMCEHITDQCVAVKDKVWDIFLADIAPTIKSAELIAESDLRTSCIGKISACFQKGCAEHFDQSKDEANYNMCLTRPETMRSICKVELDACEPMMPMVMTADGKQESVLWEYIRARLAAMRIDNCTNDVKECLTSTDRCGKDYTQCIGLDTDTIVRMCPSDKLVGCQLVYGSADIRDDRVYDELARIVQGIMLAIDNNMLSECNKAVDASMIKVCGDTESCNELAMSQSLGGDSVKYEACRVDQMGNLAGCVSRIPISENLKNEAWAGTITGIIHWDLINITPAALETDKFINIDDYEEQLKTRVGSFDATQKKAFNDRVVPELQNIISSIKITIQAIESDPKVQYCMTGREVQGVNTGGSRQIIGGRGAELARFPNITQSMRMIIALRVLNEAKENYRTAFNKAMTSLMEDSVSVAEKVDQINREEAAAAACKDLAGMSNMAFSPTPPASRGWFKWVVVAAAIAAIPFTAGASAIALPGLVAGTTISLSAVGIASVVAAGAMAGAIASSIGGSGPKNYESGHAQLNQWNYKETVTTTFNPTDMVCHKVRVFQNCEDRNDKKQYCKRWSDPKEVAEDIRM